MTCRLLLIDQYDSFIYNLDHMLRAGGAHTQVVRPEAFAPNLLQHIDGLVLSPGPGSPEEAHAAHAALRLLRANVPVLGVCLGHQVLAQADGAVVSPIAQPMHGCASRVIHDGSGLFAGLPSEPNVGRYHSLAVVPHTLPERWHVNARTHDGVIMSMHHRTLPRYGVQFHPESVLTDGGAHMLATFLNRCGEGA